MSEIDLAAIKARCDSATDGPWTDRRRTPSRCDILRDGNVHFRIADDVRNDNAAFIVHARADVPALVAEVERLRAEVERLTNER